MPKLIIASNRLPVTMTKTSGALELSLSNGGLVSGLKRLLEEESTLWVGWSGSREPLHTSDRSVWEKECERLKFLSVELDENEITSYYDGVSNAILWPLYHYLIDKLELDLCGWNHYQSANQKFADKILEVYEPGDFVWIHDYHLQLVPKMIRAEVPDAKIGFFLHIPFPDPDVFRILPWREEVLEGILGADIIGFHTASYGMNFQASLLRVLGVECLADQLRYEGRHIRLGTFPLGVDIQALKNSSEAADPGKVHDIRESIKSLKARASHESTAPEDNAFSVLLAIDRMDYTKGLPRRLMAIERLLETYPELSGQMTFIQIAAPSRDKVPAYEKYKETVDGLVGRINGRFGSPGYQPIHYLSQNYSQGELVELYKLVDVMLVTPIRDGMNLVAKEFVASREDEDGVLVLSEFAGAAEELGEAILINPYNIQHFAESLRQAISMSEEERTSRMKSLRQRVIQFDASTWGRRFMDFLHTSPEEHSLVNFSSPRGLLEIVPTGQKIKLFLDYDGTLFPIVRIPKLAKPDDALMNLLHHLSRQEGLEIHIVSGRPRETMEQWFPVSPIHLHAEHGAFSRRAGELEWFGTEAHMERSEWIPFVRATLEEFCKNTPGSFIEEKEYSITWHYRMCEPTHAENMSRVLRAQGRESFAPMGLDIVPAKKAVEIKLKGINKGVIIKRHAREEAGSARSFAIAMGDDVTDEDMFRAMDENGLTVVIGDHSSHARHRLRSPVETRLFLEALAQRMHL